MTAEVKEYFSSTITSSTLRPVLLPALATSLALGVYQYQGAKVGSARKVRTIISFSLICCSTLLSVFLTTTIGGRKKQNKSKLEMLNRTCADLLLFFSLLTGVWNRSTRNHRSQGL